MLAVSAHVAIVAGVFLAATALDYAAALYNRALREDRYHAAGLWSIGMCLLSTAAILSLVDYSRWTLIPECLGLYFGTRLARRAPVLRSGE